MRFYDRKGEPLTLHEANTLLGDPNYVVVARHREDGYLVSTVWLGTDHNWTGSGPPTLFETMIFGPEDWGGEHCERFSTETAALAGHDQAIMRLRNEILGGAR